jgi:signal recognition particle subunit SEC65
MKTLEQVSTAAGNPEAVYPAAEWAPAAYEIQEQADALEQDMSELRRLLENSRVEEARVLVKDLAVRWPKSDRVQHMAKVLAPSVARVIPGPPHRSLEKERDWYKSHGHEYPGCWIALLGDQLLAADPSYLRVKDLLSIIPGSDDAVFFFRRPDAA